MSSASETSAGIRRATPGWVWAVGVCAAFTIVIVSFHFAASFARLHEVCSDDPTLRKRLGADVFAILPYGLVLLLLGTRRLKAGLPLALACGAALTAGIPLLGTVFTFEHGFSGPPALAMFLAQGALAVTASVAYFKTRRSFRDIAILAAITAGAFTYLAVVWSAYFYGTGIPSNAASAVGSLRTTNMAEITYASTYGHGYSPTLAVLGPPAQNAQPMDSAAGLVDEALASGREGGYTFTYTPGPQDVHGMIDRYTLSARPLKYGETGTRSFFTDQTGVIHCTNEDRPAAAKDPAIEG